MEFLGFTIGALLAFIFMVLFPDLLEQAFDWSYRQSARFMRFRARKGWGNKERLIKEAKLMERIGRKDKP